MNSLNFSDPFGIKDPFNTIGTDLDQETPDVYKIHLRVQQRNARQRITTLTGLPNSFDHQRLSKSIKKRLCCNGSVVDDQGDKALQFTGDQRSEIAKFLIEEDIAKKADITVHGY